MGVSLASTLVAPSAIAREKEAPKVTNSVEFGKVAGPFQTRLNALLSQKGKLPPPDLKAAAAAMAPDLDKMESSIRSPLDRLIWGDWQRQIGGMADNNALMAKGLQNMLDSGQLQPDMISPVSATLGQIAYLAKNYPAAIKVLGPLMNDPKLDDAVPQMLAESYNATGNPKAGLDALKTAIAARKAAGAPAPEDWYTRANAIAYNAKLHTESAEWALLLVAAYPTPINWLGAAQLLRSSQTNFTGAEDLDLGRLMDQTGVLKLEPKYAEREYISYLQAIDARRFPGETVRIAEQGIASGVLKPDDAFLKEALGQARPRVAADKASLPSLAKEAAASPSGKMVLAAADTFLSYGDAARADELYTAALAKGGVDVDRDHALIRLGIAQIGEGKYADAKVTLAKVGGPRASIAQLWAIYADQKSAGK